MKRANVKETLKKRNQDVNKGRINKKIIKSKHENVLLLKVRVEKRERLHKNRS
jgi:hypothetical protein